MGKHFGLNSVKIFEFCLAYTKLHLIRSTTSNEDTLLETFLVTVLALDRNLLTGIRTERNFILCFHLYKGICMFYTKGLKRMRLVRQMACMGKKRKVNRVVVWILGKETSWKD